MAYDHICSTNSSFNPGVSGEVAHRIGTTARDVSDPKRVISHCKRTSVDLGALQLSYRPSQDCSYSRRYSRTTEASLGGRLAGQSRCGKGNLTIISIWSIVLGFTGHSQMEGK